MRMPQGPVESHFLMMAKDCWFSPEEVKVCHLSSLLTILRFLNKQCKVPLRDLSLMVHWPFELGRINELF